MNQKAVIFGVVLVVVALAVLVFVDPLSQAGEVHSEFGRFEVSVDMVTEDGETLSMTGSALESFEVTNPEGSVVTSARIELNAVFDTPEGAEPYDVVEFEMAPYSFQRDSLEVPTSGEDAKLDAAVRSATGTNIWEGSVTRGEGDHTFGQTQFDDLPSDYVLTCLYKDVVFDDVFSAAADSGTYTLEWQFSGICAYRGATGVTHDYDYDDWHVINLAQESISGTVEIEHTGQEVSVSWNSNLVWN